MSPQHVARLEAFLEKIKGETYPELPTELHTTITGKMIEYMLPIAALSPGAKLLDVGCGQGVAIRRFTELGFKVTGITLNAVDVIECQRKGYDVLEMDQSYLDFPDEHFDIIWCRHCLEHSIYPLFTLSGFSRVLKKGGWLYVEVPAPDTGCNHQGKKNHYSVLNKSVWTELITRSGFRIVDSLDIDFQVTLGSDLYWAFIQQKE